MKRPPRDWIAIIPPGIAVGMIMTFCAFSITLTYLRFVSRGISEQLFCTTDDPVYQRIVRYQDVILAVESDRAGRLYSVTDPTEIPLPDGTFISIDDSSSRNRRFYFISTGFSFPDTPEGTRGYLFVLYGRPSSYWTEGYNAELLGKRVDCYRR